MSTSGTSPTEEETSTEESPVWIHPMLQYLASLQRDVPENEEAVEALVQAEQADHAFRREEMFDAAEIRLIDTLVANNEARNADSAARNADSAVFRDYLARSADRKRAILDLAEDRAQKLRTASQKVAAIVKKQLAANSPQQLDDASRYLLSPSGK